MPQRTEDLLTIADEIEEERDAPTEYNESYGTELADEDMEDEDLPAEDDPEDRLQMLVQRAAEEALLWREEDLDFEQAKATDYYMGRPFGNEAEGRSRVVSTDVRDTIQAILPSLMRIFFGPEKTVEYEPVGPDDQAGAEQATDMAQYVIRNDNNGFLQIHAALKDAMIRKLGVIKVWWDDSERTEGTRHTGLSEQSLIMLEDDEEVEVEIDERYPVAIPGSPTGFEMFYDVNVTRTHTDGRVKFAAIPPEEFIFSPEARDRESAEMMGHVRSVPASELIAMGIDPDLVEEHKGRVARPAAGDDLQAERRFDQDQRQELHDERDEARDECWFGEIYIYADMSEDGLGTADLIEVRVIGDSYEVVDWNYCDERPFALFCPDPEPHTLLGLSIADYVMDIQLINSNIWRGMLDSLTLTLNPRTEVVETEVNMPDLMNHEIGGILRVNKPGMVREVTHSFVGKEALPVLQYMGEIKENRTGISKAAMGLDADALQSSTKAAVAATLSSAQQHIEMLSRIFAETGFSQLYKLILKNMIQHQDKPRMVRLRNEWVDVDPASWNANMDVTVNLALGAGSSEEKLQILSMISAKQAELMQQGSPLVSLVEYRKSLARGVELAGYPNSDEFFKPWGQQEEEAYQQQKAQEPEQDPAMMLAQATIEIEKQKLELERQEAVMKDDRERAKMQMDFAIKQATAELQYGAQMNNQELQADIQRAKAIIDADARTRQMQQAQQAQGGQGGAQQGAPSGPGGGGQPAP